MTADALVDVVLDVTSNRHADATRASTTPFVITFGPVNAGRNIDLYIGDSLDKTGLGGPNGVHVHRASEGSVTDFGQNPWHRFFRPDCAQPGMGTVPCPFYELATFATGSAAVTGHYLFAATATDFGDPEPGDRPTGAAYLTASHDILVRHLGTGVITYTAMVNTDSDANLDGQLVLLTNGFVNAEEVAGDLRVGDVTSSGSDVTLWSPARILDAEDDAVASADPIAALSTLTPTTGTDVRGVNITMYAGLGGTQGGIGTPTNWLEIDVDVLNGSPLGVLKAFDNTTANSDGIYITETSGDLKVHTVHSLKDVALGTLNGSIVDARNGGAGDEDADVLGRSIDLIARGGSIGANVNDLEIDSSRGDTVVIDNDTALEALPGASDVGLRASNSIYLTETDSYLRLVLADAQNGNVRLTVRESNDGLLGEDDDLFLLKDGAVRFHEDDPAPPLPGMPIPNGMINASSGSVLLRVGDDLRTHQNSLIRATNAIDIYGDHTNGDLNYGSTMVFRGDITSGYLTNPANSPPLWLTTIFGNTDLDTIQFGDESGVAGGTTLGSAGYIHLGSKTRAYGSAVVPAVQLDGSKLSTGDDGEDRFFVYYLQSMLVGSGQVGQPAGAGHTLTLDGQADSDTYTVQTTGSTGSVRNYVINILDTGASHDGVDEGFILGRETTDDIFLLRASRCIDTDGTYGLNPDGTCLSPTESADRPGLVALLHGTVGQYQQQNVPPGQTTAVQRINYDTALNARLDVFGYGGNDSFYADDTTVTITLDGGSGADTFQIGQIFGAKRNVLEGGVAPADTFPTLVATTRGWLSPGISAPLVALGGTGNDSFTVYSNQAELRLEGGDQNDIFTVRAFALAATCDRSADGDTDCDIADVSSPLDPITGTYPTTVPFGTCGSGATLRKDNNGDGVCNAADAMRRNCRLARRHYPGRR